MKTVYLGLGSNLGDRRGLISDALRLLEDPRLKVTRVSGAYETEPLGFAGQPWFLNLVAEAETSLFPLQLLGRLQRVERQLGRARTVVNGPRTIDIDILFYGRSVVQAPRLTVPHPRAHERRFVLEPLAELAPELVHPVLGMTVRELLANIKGQKCRKA